MNKQLIAFLIICIIASLTIVSAGNNTTPTHTPTPHIEPGSTIEATESGDSNISFSDGYKGYCIEWGEHSAERGDKFYVRDEADNNIKVFFVYFYDEAQKDVITTQHMIWKFSDNKEFSRFNKTLYNNIIETAKTVQVPNQGVKKINNTTEMLFSFRTFISSIEEHQNYFGYKILFRDIVDNSSMQINNSTINNSTNSTIKYQNNETNIQLFNSTIIKHHYKNITSTLDDKKIEVSSHVTGAELKIAIVLIFFLCMTLIVIRVLTHQ